jgi:hypothetical protein
MRTLLLVALSGATVGVCACLGGVAGFLIAAALDDTRPAALDLCVFGGVLAGVALSAAPVWGLWHGSRSAQVAVVVATAMAAVLAALYLVGRGT